jgi:hypothetical protein
MSKEKSSLPSPKGKTPDPNRTQEIRVLPDGSTVIEWVTVAFSEFIIENVYSKEDRELAHKMGQTRIFCG